MPIFLKIIPLRGAHNENGGFRRVSSRSRDSSIDASLGVRTFPIHCRKNKLGISSEGLSYLACYVVVQCGTYSVAAVNVSTPSPIVTPPQLRTKTSFFRFDFDFYAVLVFILSTFNSAITEDMMGYFNRYLALLGCLGLICLIGCRGGDSNVGLVTGKVMVDGEPIEIDIVTYSKRAALPPTAELTQAFLQAIGVASKVSVGEYGASNDAIANGSADMFLQAWVTTPQGDPGSVLEGLLKSDGGSNSGKYSNPELDDLLEQGRSVFDHEERKNIYNRVQEIVAEDAALIPVFHVSQVNVARAGLSGYAVHPTETYWVTHETALEPVVAE